MVIRNEDVLELELGVPEGHRHLRARFLLSDGTEIVFSEATVANLVRAFVTVKTHPAVNGIRLTGRTLEERKDGFARWQLLEEAG